MLRKITLLSAILPVATALTEPCFGPGACSPPAAVPPPVSVGTAPGFLPPDLGGSPVVYEITLSADGGETHALAKAMLHGAYSVVGESGPCPAGEACPALQQQAFDDLKTKAYRANRAGRLMP